MNRFDGENSAAFWVGGLAVLIDAAVFFAFPGRGEAFESAEHLALGLCVPALAAVLARAREGQGIRSASSWLFLAFVAFYALRVLPRLEMEAFVGAALVAASLYARGERSKELLAAAAIAAGIGTLAALRLLWWDGGWAILRRRGAWPEILFAGSLLLGARAFFDERRERLRPGPWDAAAVLLFALSATRLSVDPHDGAFFAGTVELLRHGGRLLWSVPSQYGFLSVALASAMPTPDPWRAVYVLNSALLFVSAAAVYAALRRATRGAAGVAFSVLLAWSSVLLVPGRVWILDGPNALPSVGAFRFIWAYVLLAWAALAAARGGPETPIGRRLLLAGAALWTAGCLWSCESAVYASAAAWPAFVLAARDHARAGRRRDAAIALAAPLIVLAAAVFLVQGFYRLRDGFGPDWRGFFEYALAYQGGFGALPIRPAGAVAVLVWVAVLLVAAAAIADKDSRASRLMPSAFAVVWAASTYFVSRSHDNNVLNLAPLWLFALALALRAVERARGSAVLLAGALPLSAGLFLAAFGRPAPLTRYVASLGEPRDAESLSRRLPPPDAETAALLEKARVPPDEPVAFFWRGLLRRADGPDGAPLPVRSWLAVAPAPQIGVLPLERQRVYVRRALAEEKGAGWILMPKAFDRPDLKDVPIVSVVEDRLTNPGPAGLIEEVLADRRLDRSAESANWTLRRFVPK